jgi:hypothetical protein
MNKDESMKKMISTKKPKTDEKGALA